MFQYNDGVNGLKWSSFQSNVCLRVGQSAYDEWGHKYFPNADQINTVTCRKRYPQCSEGSFGKWPNAKDEINDGRVSKTCEYYDDSDASNGCKR